MATREERAWGLECWGMEGGIWELPWAPIFSHHSLILPACGLQFPHESNEQSGAAYLYISFLQVKPNTEPVQDPTTGLNSKPVSFQEFKFHFLSEIATFSYP